MILNKVVINNANYWINYYFDLYTSLDGIRVHFEILIIYDLSFLKFDCVRVFNLIYFFKPINLP